MRAKLVTLPSENCRDREKQDLQVASQRDALYILDVEIRMFVHLSVATRLDLPETGQARLDRVPVVLPGLVAGDDTLQLRSGTDETQLSRDYVPKLRQLVEAPLPEGSAHRCEARIVGVLVSPAS